MSSVVWAQDQFDAGTDGGTDGGQGDTDIDFPELCPDNIVGCDTQDIDWLYTNTAIEGFDFDTGWVPSSGPIQLRLGLVLGGETSVAMGGTAVTSWPEALTFELPGRPGTGSLSINYGFEIIAQLKIDIDLLLDTIEWEGDIPIPFIPEDLRMAGETIFDPFVLMGAEIRPITVADSTDRVRVIRYDAISGFIDIPGLGGGIQLVVQSELEAEYDTNRIVIEDQDPITEEGGTILIDPPEPTDPDDVPGYGAGIELTIHPEGNLWYNGTITISPDIYLEFLGVRYDYSIVEIPIDIIELYEEVIFEDETIYVPLPDVDTDPSRLDFDWLYVGEQSEQYLTIVNDGDAPLRIRAESQQIGAFSVEPSELIVEPRSDEDIEVTFQPENAGTAAVMFGFTTNDPDEPRIVVLFDGEALEMPVEEEDTGPGDADIDADDQPLPDGDVGEDADGESDPTSPSGGCDCQVSGDNGNSGPLSAILLFAAFMGVFRLFRR